MRRPELIALSPDDLAVLTNRGVVKRAQRELEAGEPSVAFTESDDGEVVARWSDAVECRLPAGKALADAHCNCNATELCRHVVRTVLAYQRVALAPASEEDEAGADAKTETKAGADACAKTGANGAPRVPIGPWDPGAISDDLLTGSFRPALVTKSRVLFEQGLLVELVRSAKPTARFHVPPQTVRFLVPGDLRYVHCDCAEQAPCRHVLLAVWAFRLLDPAAEAGLVSTQRTAAAVPTTLLDEIETLLVEWFEHGTAAAPRSLLDRLARLETRARSEGLVWPAEVIDELARRFEQYLGHDALFEPNRIVDLFGELLIRSDAIRHDTGAVPQLLIRGSAADRPSEVGSARYLGLGCGVQVGRKSATVTSYLQDVATGTVVALGRDFADPVAEAGSGSGPPEPPREFWRLAQTPAVKGASYAALGAGQLTIQGGKRTSANRLVVGRGRAVVNPQAFSWEQVRAPVLAEDFDELRARLGVLPPASLRPRRVAEDFHVVPIAGVDSAGFDAAAQVVRATLRDAVGGLAALEHPSYSRGREGVDALLVRLACRPESVRFVAGHSKLGPHGLVLHPVAVVFETGPSQPKDVLQPWVDRTRPLDAPASPAPASTSPAAGAPRSAAVDPVDDYTRQLRDALGELALLGLSRVDSHSADRWLELARYGESLGFHRLVRPVATLATALEQKRHSSHWNPRAAAPPALDLALLVRLALDINA